ncbi:MAG: glycosyltransferase family 39 protein [Capnocytophaga sp.]|nr:glycosyltransferase family 39 protein [Capnocytophaga sp.]
MNFSFSERHFAYLYIGIISVYIIGMFLPVMDLDSAQDATMAARMYTENDYWNIYRGHAPYLDKPHMHFWLSAFSYALFGISEFAYRLPAVCLLMLGAYAVFRLGRMLYDNRTGHFSALIFLSAQSIILSAHDVRTDAVLTGATVFAIYQAVDFLKNRKLLSVLLAGFFAGIAFDTKGLIALVVIGLCLVSYIAYERSWKKLLSYQFLLGLLALAMAISPVLYAYYQQYDLHPELVIKGQTNVSGVRFILFDQVFNRLNATGFDETSPDYFFFFHTLLWVFLPFSLIGYAAIFNGFKRFFKIRFRKINGMEFLTLGGTVAAFLLFSFSKFKLPHYLNILIPTLSILTAAYVTRLASENRQKTIRIWAIIQSAIAVLTVPLVVLLSFFAFDVPALWLSIIIALSGICVLFFAFKASNTIYKIVAISVITSIWINVNLNSVFYPKLLEYQGGLQLAKIVQDEKIDTQNIFSLDGRYFWTFDFYTKQQTPHITSEKLANRQGETWLVIDSDDFEMLKKQFEFSEIREVKSFHVTRLSLKFLNKKTRENVLSRTYLVKIN